MVAQFENFLALSVSRVHVSVFQHSTVNPEIFARILFSRKALKDTFVALRIRD